MFYNLLHKYFTTSILCLLIIVVLASCVPQKDLIYLQPNKDQLPIEVHEIYKKPYRLSVDDILNITINTSDKNLTGLFSTAAPSGNAQVINPALMFSETALYFTGYKVDHDGNIFIPVLEKIKALNKTVDELRDEIEKRLLSEYLTKDANLFVNVKIGGIRYTINGEINKPGVNFIYNDKATIMDAISQSGDISMVGNRKEVIVYRQFPHGIEIGQLDLTKLEAMNSPFYYINPNDFIYIKPLKQKSYGTGTTGLQTFTTLVSAFSLIFTTILLIRR